jgi:hypothetical protein
MKERSYFYYDELDSTMLEYKRLREVHKGLISVRTEKQEDGVGRNDKVWLSPPGGLWFTFDIRYSGFVASFGLYTGYCIHRELCNLFSPLVDKLQIKWTKTSSMTERSWGIAVSESPWLLYIGWESILIM